MKKLLLAVVVVALTLVIIEAYARTQQVPRIQAVMSATSPGFSVHKGVPVWEVLRDKEGRQNKSCVDKTPDGRADVLLLGDSIFHGVKLEVEEKLGAQIGQRLSPSLGRPACVVNLAEPGFLFQNERVLAERDMDSVKPKIVVLEVWGNSPYKYRMVGGNAYNFGYLGVAKNGLPPVKFVPDMVNHSLFLKSAIWRQLNIRFATKGTVKSSDLWTAWLQDELIPFHRWLEAQGATLMLAYPTALATPFSEPRKGETTYSLIQEWADGNGVATLYFQEVFSGEDFRKVRLDPCCHLNAYGTEKIADAMAPWLAKALGSEESVD
jgi:hypothetical protein